MRTIISTQERMVDYIVPAHQSDEFDSFNPDALDIFEENEIEIFKDENNNEDDCYVSEEDEDFILNESEIRVISCLMRNYKIVFESKLYSKHILDYFSQLCV